MFDMMWVTNADSVLKEMPLKAQYVILRSLAAKADVVFARLREKIVSEKLSGQMLTPRSYKLQESVEIIPAKIVGSTVEAGIRLNPEVARYGAYYEMGGKSQYIIKPRFARALAISDATFNPATAVKMSDEALLSFLIRNPNAPVPTQRSDAYAQVTGESAMTHLFRMVSHPPIRHIPFLTETFAEFLPEIIATLGPATPEETGWQGYTSPE